MALRQEAKALPNSSIPVHPNDQRPHRTTLIELMRKPSDHAKRRNRKALIKSGAEGVRTPDPHTASLIWTVPLTCISTVLPRQTRCKQGQFDAVQCSWTRTRAPGLLQSHQCERPGPRPVSGYWTFNVDLRTPDGIHADVSRVARSVRRVSRGWAAMPMTLVIGSGS
jgi:hypothetical protein